MAQGYSSQQPSEDDSDDGAEKIQRELPVVKTFIKVVQRNLLEVNVFEVDDVAVFVTVARHVVAVNTFA